MENKSKLIGQHLKNNRQISVLGMPLTNANGAIDSDSTGYDYVMRTTSEIRSRIIEQKFFELSISDYIPMDVGEAAWKDEIIQNIAYNIAGDFYQGDVDDMAGNGKIAEVSSALAPIRMPVITWAKGVSWNVAEVAKAAASSNWDPIATKMRSLKKNWDLGIQETAFLGHPSVTGVSGLLNDSEVTINTTLIAKPLSDMSETEFTAFIKAIVNAYFSNSNSTSMPDTFVMPTDDYLGMGVPFSPTYPTVIKLDYLENLFKKTTRNPNFKVLPLPYAQDDINTDRGINKNRYVLYKNDSETMSMSIPVDFSMYEAGTANNIYWQQPAMGQYSGLLINRKPEVLYLDETP